MTAVGKEPAMMSAPPLTAAARSPAISGFYSDHPRLLAFPLSLETSFGKVILKGAPYVTQVFPAQVYLECRLGAVGVGSPSAQQMGRVRGFDHVSVPMANTDAMLAFYKALGFDIAENANAISIYVGDNMINFHRPSRWQDKTFTTRAPAAVPPCGDYCFVWEGTAESLKAMLDRAAAKLRPAIARTPFARA
jgi:hypothetical protein